jgi:trypsin
LNAIRILGDRQPSRGGRIVGGNDADIENHAYQIGLFYNRRHSCGGSVLNANTILSAAHCTSGRVQTNFQILAGSSFISRVESLAIATGLVEHPQYNDWTAENDIVVLKLANNLVFGSSIRPLPLPVPNFDVQSGAPCNISGWGDLEFRGGRYPDRLQNVIVPAMTNQECQIIYDEEEILPTHICAGEFGRDACQGDSGGPLVHNNVHVGIVSWGYGCAFEFPTVYTRVSEFLGFILSNL